MSGNGNPPDQAPALSAQDKSAASDQPATEPAQSVKPLRTMNVDDFRAAVTGREATVTTPLALPLSGRENTLMPDRTAGSLTGREPTMTSPAALSGSEPTMVNPAKIPLGSERTLTETPSASITGREMTLQALPSEVTGRERTLTDTPDTVPAGSAAPAGTPRPATDPAARKPKTLGATRPITGNGTSANFDDAWHLQGRKGPFTGQTWEDFDIGGILGEGGMGAVYRAKQRSLYRRVALKVLPPNLAADTRLLERFMLEARTASTMQSPHIVQVYAIGEHDGNHYFAMEYVEGTDLYEVMKARKEANNPITADEAGDYILQATKGLAEAARHGIVHRDIKPPNLMVTRKDNLVKIADFGIVKVMGEHNLTMTGQAIGTPAYVSPEQGRGDREIDQRSDLYSLGVVFYELLCGKKPFEGTTPSALIYQHCYDEPELPQKIKPGITNEYQAVVLKCLQKKPENRYQNADELITDLQAIKTGVMLKVALANYKGTGADEARREQMNWIQRNLLKVALAAGVVVLGGGSLVYLQITKQNEARAAITEKAQVLSDLDRATSLPQGVDTLLKDFALIVGPTDERVVKWQDKISRVREREKQLAPLDQSVTAALRATAPKIRDDLMVLVGKDAPNVIRWNKILDEADQRDRTLRDTLLALDKQALDKPLRDQLKPRLDQLRVLAPAADRQVSEWVRLIDHFDANLTGLTERMTPIDNEKGNISQEHIKIYDGALEQLRPLLGKGDKDVVRWDEMLGRAKGIVGKLQKSLAETLAKYEAPPRLVQDQIAPNLQVLKELVGADDAEIKGWDSKIKVANETIKNRRQRLTAAFQPLAADEILAAGQIDPLRTCWKELDALELPGDPEVLKWKARLDASAQTIKDLDERLRRLDVANAEPIPVAEQVDLSAALIRLDTKGGVDRLRLEACRLRLTNETKRVAQLREKLQVLNQVQPLTDTVRSDLKRLVIDVGSADADAVIWLAKVARVDDLIRKLEPLANDQAIVPQGCSELYAKLVVEVGSDDVQVGRFAPRFKQVQEVETALAPVDKTGPLPNNVAASIERSANLFGAQDPIHLKRTAKVQRVGALKKRLSRLEAAVVESATELITDRAAFDELVKLVGPGDAEVPLFARRLAQLIGPERPVWASSQGRDQYGLWVECSLRGAVIRFRFCPQGRMIMGSPDSEIGRQADEVPVPVSLSKGFWIAESECTQAFWKEVMGDDPSHRRGAQRPVERVSYDEVRQFLTRLSSVVAGLSARLPSEAEWEYACRAGSLGSWSGSEASAEKVAWYAGNADGGSHEVKLRFPNALGLYDMHGNVWEWCEDRYGAYPTSAVSDWLGRSGQLRVVRGGSWGDAESAARSANRQGARDDLRSAYVGFRLAVDAQWSGVPDGSALLAKTGSTRNRLEIPLGGGGKISVEIEMPETGAKP